MLRLENDISDMCVAQRLSWAGYRRTTRPEDVAYCLLGLFGITIPLSYGEGSQNAFYRLQEEIMKTNSDISIFVWGIPYYVKTDDISKAPEMLNNHLRKPPQPYLLASSPNAFREGVIPLVCFILALFR